MVDDYEILELALPHDSPFVDFLLRCPDIELRAFNDGEYLIRQGDRDADTFVVISGACAIESQSEVPSGGPPKILATIDSDERNPSFVGEMAYLGGVFRTASVRSVGRTYTFCLKPRHLDVLIDHYPFFTRVLCKQFTERLKEANEQILMFHQRLGLKAEPCHYDAGALLYEEGKPPEFLYRLLQGKLVCDPLPGETKRHRPKTLFDFVEPFAFLSGSPAKETVRTDSRSMLVRFHRNDREALLRNHPELVIGLLENLSSEK